MRTLQEKYNAVLEGTFSKEQFRRDAVMQLPNLVSKFNSFEDMATILKNRGMLAEAKKEEVTAYKKPEVETADLIAPDLLDDGIKAELEAAGIEGTPSEEEYEKAKEKAAKNLAKDPLCYKNAQTMPEMGEKMEKAKLKEEKNTFLRDQEKLRDELSEPEVAAAVADEPALVGKAFTNMVMQEPEKYKSMSKEELVAAFEEFKANYKKPTEEITHPEDKHTLTPDELGYSVDDVNEAEAAKTLADILKNKGTLDHLKGIERLRLKLIDGPFLKKNPDWKDKAVKFIRYDARQGLVLIDWNDTSGFAYPSELVIDTEATNMMEDVRTQLKEAVKALIKKTLEA
jgi:hypothetical protein